MCVRKKYACMKIQLHVIDCIEYCSYSPIYIYMTQIHVWSFHQIFSDTSFNYALSRESSDLVDIRGAPSLSLLLPLFISFSFPRLAFQYSRGKRIRCPSCGRGQVWHVGKCRQCVFRPLMKHLILDHVLFFSIYIGRFNRLIWTFQWF